jgi:hypothetical protein
MKDYNERLSCVLNLPKEINEIYGVGSADILKNEDFIKIKIRTASQKNDKSLDASKTGCEGT